jgi:hypothetical protein
MICPNPHPAPDNKANSKFVPVGKPLDVTTANIIAKINVPTVVLSGAGWGFGQIITFKAFELVGSSRAMPVTTAFQSP